jgi:hypothetical protein
MNDNKLIAEFMGVETTDGLVFQDNNTHEFHPIKYHTEWNWLMPVGEKIDAMFGEDDEVDDAINRVHNAVLSFDIDNTYRAIVEFIKEYNK